MSEYIKREEVLCYKRTMLGNSRSGDYNAEAVLVEDINKIRSVDVAPIKYGFWLWNGEAIDWGLGAWICSECKTKNDNIPYKEKINPYDFVGSFYCPHCGAKMGK